MSSSNSRLHTPAASTSTSTSKHWVDPAALPPAPSIDVTTISGNVPDYAKQLVCNVFHAYGVGSSDQQFGYALGRATRFVDMSVEHSSERAGRMEGTTVAEVAVTKHMLNGAGMLHGGCVTYLIDNCASTPLVLLGIMSGQNGVGVTQGMNVLFHAPAPIGTVLRIISSSISMGSRVMSARCEIVDKASGRVVASAFLNKMQPVPPQSRL
ncbi:4HBT domain-containing protein [Favolaschia claudopus]|uniref:4HBT domain-containing protein n=1 Tax=Favolaschia claudopus TaxID=2862362 RepID=A0AAW0E818_9AGAR